MKKIKIIDAIGILLGAVVLVYNFLYVLTNMPESIIAMSGLISVFLFMAIYFLSYNKIKMTAGENLIATILVYLIYIVGFVVFKIYIFSPLAWSLTAVISLWIMSFIIGSKYNVKLGISKKMVTIFLFFYFLISVFWRVTRSYENYLALISTLIFIILIFLAYLVTINLKEGRK